MPDRPDTAVLVVDVGGATTDVYPAVSPLSDVAAEQHAVALPAQRRTVEGDLGMRISAPGVVADAAAAVDARLAAVLAVRRHLRMIDNRLGPRGAGLLVLSGCVFRHADPAALSAVTATLRADPAALSAVTATLRADPVLRPILRHAAPSPSTCSPRRPAHRRRSRGHG